MVHVKNSLHKFLTKKAAATATTATTAAIAATWVARVVALVVLLVTTVIPDPKTSPITTCWEN